MTGTALVGFSHVVLTVSDLARSTTWYEENLDFVRLFPWNTPDFSRWLLAHPSGMVLGLTQHEHHDRQSSFTPTVNGLDHLSFAVSSHEQLQAWQSRFDRAGITHSGIQVLPESGFTLLPFRDPDSIQLELYLHDQEQAD